MFLCGGPVYAAGETTGAINIALIMSLSPVIVTLIVWLRGLERTFAAYLFAGIVPGLLAYTGFAWLTGRFGAVRASLILYLGPAVSAVLSYLLLNEPPHLFHFAGGALILLGVWASLRKQLHCRVGTGSQNHRSR